MEKIQTREVAQKEVYDSFYGMLRVSPNIDPITRELIDNPTIDTCTLNKNIILSDSNGNELPLIFTPKAKTTRLIDNKELDLVNMTINLNNDVFIRNSLNLRSTLTLNNSWNSSGKSSFEIRSLKSGVGSSSVYNVLLYPSDSPFTSEYFNSEEKFIELDDISGNYPQQIKDELFKIPLSSYKLIDDSQFVRINGNIIYTSNEINEKVPILYTHDYALGVRKGHSGKTTQEVKNKWIKEDSILINSGNFTKLSYINIDKLVWKAISNIVSGDIRHYKGRYDELGKDKTISILERYGNPFDKENRSINTDEDDNNFPKTAPLIAQGVPSGLIMYNAMSLSDYLFYATKEELRNKKEEGKTIDFPSDDSGLTIITQNNKSDKGFTKTLGREFICCDGRDINYNNYPNMNTSNKKLFDVDADNFDLVKRNTDNSPIELSINDRKGVYAGIHGLKSTPPLLETDDKSLRYIRSFNWTSGTHDLDDSKPMNIINFNESSLKNNNLTIEVIPKEFDEHGYFNVVKDINKLGMYRVNYDFNQSKGNSHYHYSFSGELGQNSHNYEQAVWDFPSGNGCEVNYKWHLNTDLLKRFTEGDDNSDQWFNYCLNLQSEYNGMTAIKTSGLYAFNTYYYNKNGNYNTGGTSNHIESLIDNGQLYINNGVYDENNKLETIKKDKSERLKQLVKINEVEGRSPISYFGGSNNLYIRNRWQTRASRGISGNRRAYWVGYNYTGGYSIVKNTGKGNNINRCITSLPVPDKEKLGIKELSETSQLPIPSSINLLPLLKI